jgi:NAD(P)-dependent dehydrogenase (short-subunit alcohol dehydrogenase family)
MKTALITGGTGGIGLAIAKALLKAGYQVTITSRDQARLYRALEELGATGQLVSGLVCDVADPASVRGAFQQFQQRHKSIDALINNAGVAHELAPIEEFSIETWKRVIEVNLTGTFLVTRAALPLMGAGGTIVNNLSIASTQPFPGMSAYNAAKSGALGFTRALREEVRKRGIRVVALIPGATDTPIWQQFWPDAPREKMISPATVAESVLHAVSLPSQAAVEEIVILPAAGVL